MSCTHWVCLTQTGCVLETGVLDGMVPGEGGGEGGGGGGGG